MEKAQFLDILSKHLDGRSSKEEAQFLYAYYKLFITEPGVIELLNTNEKEKLKLSIKVGIDEHFDRTSDTVVRKIKLWPRFTAAAAILLILSVGIYFLNTKHLPEIGSGTSYVNDIAPGDKGATLTLANGKQIYITAAANGLLAKDQGLEITKSADGQITYQVIPDKDHSELSYHTLSTAKGETFQVRLPDKTVVYLNAASTLRYPTTFKNRERKVELLGEAYFEVAKNADMPFRVVSKAQTIEVLGTHFNINAYPDEEQATTTLLEGSVKIRSAGKEALLKPGQQSVTSSQNTAGSVSGISITTADTEEAVAWKNGWFQFKNADIKTVMNQIGRWYNVDVIYQGKIPEDHYIGKVSRNVKVSQVLKILETSGINFKIEGKTIIVK